MNSVAIISEVITVLYVIASLCAHFAPKTRAGKVGAIVALALKHKVEAKEP